MRSSRDKMAASPERWDWDLSGFLFFILSQAADKNADNDAVVEVKCFEVGPKWDLIGGTHTLNVLDCV